MTYRINILTGGVKTDISLFMSVPQFEEELWKPFGEVLAKHPVLEPTEFRAEGEDGRFASVLVSPTPSGGRTFKVIEDTFNLKKSLYEKKFLRRVDLALNKKSFYDLIPNTMGTLTLDIGARYGLLGTNAVEEGKVLPVPFPSQLFWARYFSKIQEGYSDETELLGDGEDILTSLFGKDDLPKEDEDTTAVQLYRMLVGAAKEFLGSQFNIDWLSEKPPYTDRQVKSAWKILEDLIKAREKVGVSNMKKAADAAIVKLLKIAAPAMKQGTSVRSFAVVGSTERDVYNDITKKADEWEQRILAMESVIAAKPSAKKDSESERIVSPFGNVEVRKATPEEFDHYKKLIEKRQPHMGGMLKDVYLLDPISRRENYEKALSEAENKDEEELFHGSITANMVSLIKSGGPTIHVSAANGRMFGNGSYWANDFDKSLGYTSYAGSRWANGASEEAFMLVGQVHVGKKYFADHGYRNSEAETVNGGYDCCYALASRTGLYRDEIITYDESHSYVKAILHIG